MLSPWCTYLPGLLVNFCRRAFTSSYVRNATYAGWVTANTFQFLRMFLHGWNSLQSNEALSDTKIARSGQLR